MEHITPDLLLKAYACGVFPMAEDRTDPGLFWVDPKQRGILPLDRFHVPRRLARLVKGDRFDVRVNSAFVTVVEACAAAADNRPSTWINKEIVRLYTALNERGYAHSVECWLDEELVGGLYGVDLGGAFFGESMFHRVTDASKVALVHLVARLKAGGYTLLDTQFVTDHLRQFGAVEIGRDAYQARLREAILVSGNFYSLPEDVASATILQLSTQTS